MNVRYQGNGNILKKLKLIEKKVGEFVQLSARQYYEYGLRRIVERFFH